MFRFDQMIRSNMTLREVKQMYPRTESLLDQLGFRPSCDDCTIETAARRTELLPRDLVDALNAAAFRMDSAA